MKSKDADLIAEAYRAIHEKKTAEELRAEIKQMEQNRDEDEEKSFYYNTIVNKLRKQLEELEEAYGKVMSASNESESLLDQLENKGMSSSADENQQDINNIAQKCHTLLTRGKIPYKSRGQTKYLGKELTPDQRQVIEQIAKLIVTII
jgi:predicted nuclease with TOPRIM domain